MQDDTGDWGDRKPAWQTGLLSSNGLMDGLGDLNWFILTWPGRDVFKSKKSNLVEFSATVCGAMSGD